jgi:hypothetical protein
MTHDRRETGRDVNGTGVFCGLRVLDAAGPELAHVIERHLDLVEARLGVGRA